MARTPKPWYWKARRSWFVTIAGRRHDLGPNKSAATDQFHKLMATPTKKRTRVRCGRLVATVIDEFLDWSQKNRAPDTYEWYRYRLERFARRYPELRADDLRPFHVENWANSDTLSTTSRRNYLRSIKRCMKWAKKQGYIRRNRIAHLEVPSAEEKEIVVSPKGFDTAMALVRNDCLADLMTVTWETGCRPQESLRVEARHVDLAHKRWVFQKSEAKSKRIARVVYLTERPLEVTRRLMLTHPHGPLFRNTSGKPWTTDAVN